MTVYPIKVNCGEGNNGEYMKKQFNLMLMTFVMTFLAAFAVEPMASQDKAVAPRYTIKLPAGGIKEFFHWTTEKTPLVSAHRGGPMAGFPENAIETFDNATKFGPMIIEMDMALTKDGKIILMHDKTLDRTTTCKGNVNSILYEELLKCNLVDNQGVVTAFKVPTLKDTLLWSRDKVVLNLDFKKSVSFASVVELVRATNSANNVVMVSRNLNQAKAMHRAGPELMLSVPIYDAAMLTDIKASGLPLDQVIAWVGTRLGDKDFYNQLHKQGLYVNLGTLGPEHRSIDGQIARAGDDNQYLDILALGVDIIATDRLKAVAKVLNNTYVFYIGSTGTMRP